MMLELKILIAIVGVTLGATLLLWMHDRAHPCLRYEKQWTTHTTWFYAGKALVPLTNTGWHDVCVERKP